MPWFWDWPEYEFVRLPSSRLSRNQYVTDRDINVTLGSSMFIPGPRGDRVA